MKRFFKILFRVLGIFSLIVLVVFGYFNIPVKSKIEKASIGVTFSYRYSRDIGLNWQENYLAVLDDLKVRKMRIPVYWDLVELENNVYDFSDLDWQVNEAEKRNVELILVVGQKVPRWPECFVPKWVEDDAEKRKIELLKFIEVVVKRYESRKVVKYWQVENEPFLPFGDCPEFDVKMLDEEISLVRSLDSKRNVIITDSGELSLWIRAAKRADVFGTTMYRNVYKEGLGYYVYPIGPRFFLFKRWLIEAFANQKNAVVIELQGEPWVSGWTVHQPLSEQFNSMNEIKLKENVEYAKESGFSEIYIWGAEWWYWLKEMQRMPALWEAAKNIISENQK